MVDVGISHPAAPSRKSTYPLAAAAAAEHKKIEHYKGLATRYGAVFQPFIVESFGAFGKHADEVMKVLRTAAALESPILPQGVGSFSDYAVKCLAMALQKGNALVARKGAIEARSAAVVGRR